jgi:hypothetical protein
VLTRFRPIRHFSLRKRAELLKKRRLNSRFDRSAFHKNPSNLEPLALNSGPDRSQSFSATQRAKE